LESRSNSFCLNNSYCFTGYVLVRAQISFWATIVIVNFFRVIPIIGNQLVLLVFGGFIVNVRTIKFFFVIHFLAPFAILLFILIHLYFLHRTGRSSSISMLEPQRKIWFYSSYWAKDSLNLFLILLLVLFLLCFPFNLGDPEMFIKEDPIVRPNHIVPEWYFLFAYAILRSIPNKSLGLVALIIRFVLIWRLRLLTRYKRNSSVMIKFLSYIFGGLFLLLSWLGQALVEAPFMIIALLRTFAFFSLLGLFFVFGKVQDLLLK